MSGSLHTDEYKKLCLTLKQARIDAGLTQKQMADKLGKPHQSYVAKYELAERRLDVIEFANVCKVLGLDIASVLAGVEIVNRL